MVVGLVDKMLCNSAISHYHSLLSANDTSVLAVIDGLRLERISFIYFSKRLILG